MDCIESGFFHFRVEIYYSQNNIGSTTLLTNKDGSDIGQFLYTPYGEMWVEEASTIDISHITRFFTNQQYDKESGLYYYNARYYDPHLGSFLTPDPSMSGINHYAYANSNPIKYTDPSGLASVSMDGYYQKQATVYRRGNPSIDSINGEAMVPSFNRTSSISGSLTMWSLGYSYASLGSYSSYISSSFGASSNSNNSGSSTYTSDVFNSNPAYGAPSRSKWKDGEYYQISGEEKYPYLLEAGKVYDERKKNMENMNKNKQKSDKDGLDIAQLIWGIISSLPLPIKKGISKSLSIISNAMTTPPVPESRSAIYNKIYSEYEEQVVINYEDYLNKGGNVPYEELKLQCFKDARDSLDRTYNSIFRDIKEIFYPKPPNPWDPVWRER